METVQSNFFEIIQKYYLPNNKRINSFREKEKGRNLNIKKYTGYILSPNVIIINKLNLKRFEQFASGVEE